MVITIRNDDDHRRRIFFYFQFVSIEKCFVPRTTITQEEIFSLQCFDSVWRRFFVLMASTWCITIHYTYYIVNILRFGYVISDILPNGRICIQNSQCLIHCTIWSNGSGLGPKAELAIKFWIILKIFFFDFLDRNLWIMLNVNKFILSNDRIQWILSLG